MQTTAAPRVQPVPEGFHTVTPSLTIRNAAAAIEFYKQAFGAEELGRATAPDGQAIWHATLQIGSSRLMLNDEFPEMGGRSPQALGGTPLSLFLYVEDTDAVFERAVAAGATALMPPMDAFWGDRFSKLTDPYGHEWSIATHIEDVTPEEAARRAQTMGCQSEG